MAKVTLDGREHELGFTIRTTRWFKRTYGKPLLDVLVPIEGRPQEATDPDCLCHLLAAGLRVGDEEMTADKAARLLEQHVSNGGYLSTVSEEIARALMESRIIGGPEPDAPGKAQTV
jgi:hypothetical protein